MNGYSKQKHIDGLIKEMTHYRLMIKRNYHPEFFEKLINENQKKLIELGCEKVVFKQKTKKVTRFNLIDI
jgi:hypothetical protein